MGSPKTAVEGAVLIATTESDGVAVGMNMAVLHYAQHVYAGSGGSVSYAN